MTIKTVKNLSLSEGMLLSKAVVGDVFGKEDYILSNLWVTPVNKESFEKMIGCHESIDGSRYLIVFNDTTWRAVYDEHKLYPFTEMPELADVQVDLYFFKKDES